MTNSNELTVAPTRELVDQRVELIKYAKSRANELGSDVIWRDLLPSFFGVVNVAGDYVAGNKYDQHNRDQSAGIQCAENDGSINSNSAETMQNAKEGSVGQIGENGSTQNNRT